MDMGLKPSHPRFRELVHKSALQFGSQHVAAIFCLLPVVHRIFLDGRKGVHELLPA